MVKTIDYGAGRVRTYGYDDLGRLSSDTLATRPTTDGRVDRLRYDLNDHVTGKTPPAPRAPAQHLRLRLRGPADLLDQGGGTTAYEWDDSGNRTKAGAKTATYDERNRLLSDGDYTYAYTAARHAEVPDQFRARRAVHVRRVRPDGRRGGRRRTPTTGSTGCSPATASRVHVRRVEPTRSVSDGSETYARGPAANCSRSARTEQAPDRFGRARRRGRRLRPGRHRPVALKPASTAYDPFGKVNRPAPATPANLGFQGDWTDPDTGQVDMGARWYEPGTGGFTSRDTSNYSQGDSILANRYTYGAGDPMSNNDPTGTGRPAAGARRPSAR
jgi:RHS repeat-associated protein